MTTEFKCDLDRPLTGVSTLTKAQSNLLGALALKNPTKKKHLSLL